jgi:site-specific DNA-methyltransferase (adenine-specific)
MIAWVYGSGFPKSHNVAIGIDKMNGAPSRGKALVVAGRGEREDLQGKDANPRPQELEAYAPATPEAAKWQGWGTALKPALEPITVARKPFTGTVAANVLQWGTGGVNVDGCRVGRDTGDVSGWSLRGSKASENQAMSGGNYARDAKPDADGRWPANLIHDGSDEVVGLFPQSTSTGGVSADSPPGCNDILGKYGNKVRANAGGLGDTGSAARFFYCAKASKADRDEGLASFDTKETASMAGNMVGGQRLGGDGSPIATQTRANIHPTVKPTALMRYLCRLVTPPGGIVLDPFTGSGSTGKAAKLEGFNFIGCEREAEYVEIARARIHSATPHQPDLFS